MVLAQLYFFAMLEYGFPYDSLLSGDYPWTQLYGAEVLLPAIPVLSCAHLFEKPGGCCSDIASIGMQ